MRSGFALAACAAALSTVSGQFLQRRDDGRDGGHVVSSSFMKTFSWFQGSDGEMHKQTQEIHNEVVQDGFDTKQTHSKVVCRDGRCQEVTMVAAQPTLQEPGHLLGEERIGGVAMPGGGGPMDMPFYNRPRMESGHLPPRLRAILERLIPMQQARPLRQPEITIERMPRAEITIERMPRAEITIERMPGVDVNDPRIANALMRPVYDDRGQKAVYVQQKAQRPPQWGHDYSYVIFAVIFAVIAATFTVMATLKCVGSHARESAREPPMRALAEPLAPAPMQVQNLAFVASVQQRKATALPMYLSNLYARANAKSDARGVKEYLSRLYTRILG